MLLHQTVSLLQETRKLELVGRKNCTGIFTGNYTSSILGHGMEFYEARKYVAGESIRLIDWNMTARLGEVFVKKLREEREREIFLAVDVSPSMFFGTQNRTKIETALEVASTLGISAIKNQDKIGMVSFTDHVTDSHRPRKGNSHFFAILKSLVRQKMETPKHIPASDIRKPILFIQNQKAKKYMVFIISDFIEHDIPDDLRLIQDKHDVVLIHIFDPFEYTPSKGVFFPFFSPEGAKQTVSGKPGSFGTFEEIESFLKGNSLKYGIDTVSISTRDNVPRRLMGYFKQKQNRQNR